MNNYGIVYCVENIETGKKYIGQTTRSTEKRCLHGRKEDLNL